MELVLAVGLAFILDMIFGDPYWLPHPICLIGKLISGLEKILRKAVKSAFWGGFILVCVVVLLCWAVPFGILFLAGLVHPILRLVVETFFCYQIFAAKSLQTESMKVHTPLLQGDLKEARKFLSYIVGRDTESLSEEGVIKATVETIAENTTDGVIAPLLFMILGGAPLAFLYKGINTMDSMIGYKNEKYLYFGRAAAILDDIANFIPARISAMLMILGAMVLGLDGKNAWKIYWRDRKNHKSPNSAQTESVCAGALGVQLAGDAYYFGKLTKKPTIGDPLRPIEASDISLTNRLMYVTSTQAVLLVMLLRGVVCFLW